MKSSAMTIVALFLILSMSWTVVVLVNHATLGQLEPIPEEGLAEGESTLGQTLYPTLPAGRSELGKKVYVEQSCAHCHTQHVRRSYFGSDQARGWGERGSVPRDYIRQDKVLLGLRRIGPDLANLGMRAKDANDLHLHLYQPTLLVPGSTMPSYKFLYEKQEISEVRGASKNALVFPEGKHIEEGYEVVPSKRAENLVAYLMSLKQDYTFPEVVK